MPGIFSDEDVAALDAQFAAAADAEPVEVPADVAAPVDEVLADPVPADPADPVEPVEPKVPHGFVPHAALHAERQRVAELRARDAQRETRLQALEAMIRDREVPEPVYVPSVEDDPVAALQRVEGGLQAMAQQRADDIAARDADNYAAQVRNYVDTDIAQFRAATPDFDDAASHLVQSRVNELRRLGYNDTDIRDDINAYDAHISNTAARAGISAAEMMYDLAKDRGYRSPAPTTATGNVTPIQPAATAKVDAIARGQASERSIGSAPGAAPAGSLDLRAILDLPDAEFAKISEAQFRNLAGG